MFFSPFASSSGVYCNDQPNALDTAVRRCSYTLTLRVLNDSGRMNHGAEVDGAFSKISQHLLLLSFICNSIVCSVFISHHQCVSWCFIKVWLIKSMHLIQVLKFYKCVKMLKDEAMACPQISIAVLP